jgi:hypothetical protein
MKSATVIPKNLRTITLNYRKIQRRKLNPQLKKFSESRQNNLWIIKHLAVKYDSIIDEIYAIRKKICKGCNYDFNKLLNDTLNFRNNALNYWCVKFQKGGR